jgi:DNA-binding transcriptional LysR family regulator
MLYATFRQLYTLTRELFLTQPTVSMQVKELSECVGLPLFEQIGKKIHLTHAGREASTYARGIAGVLS